MSNKEFFQTLIVTAIASLGITLWAYLFHWVPENTFNAYAKIFFMIFGCATVLSLIVKLVLEYFFPSTQENDSDSSKQTINVGETLYFYGNYHNGYSRVEKIEFINKQSKETKSTFAFANDDGEIVTKWYLGATDYNDPGYAIVWDGEVYNVLGADAKELSVMWFKNIGDDVTDNKLKVYWSDGTVNFFDVTTGKMLWKDWKRSL